MQPNPKRVCDLLVTRRVQPKPAGFRVWGHGQGLVCSENTAVSASTLGFRWYGMVGFAGAVGDFLLAAVAFKNKESRSLCLAGNQGQPQASNGVSRSTSVSEMTARRVTLGLAFFLLPAVSFESRDSVHGFRLYRAVAQYKCFGDDRRVFRCSCSNATVQHQKPASPRDSLRKRINAASKWQQSVSRTLASARFR